MSFYRGSQSMLFIVFGLCGALASASTTTTTTTAGFLATTTTTTPASTSTTTTTSAQGPSLVATGFVKYYDSNTTFDVHGSVWFEQILSDSEVPGQSLTWDLSGVDPACVTGSGNQCGIHIHEGTSCTENAEGHYWNETLVKSDPWTAVQYNTTDGTSRQEKGVRVITGLEMEEIVGHAVIVHDSVAPGRRIACALIKEIQTTSSSPEPPSPNGFPWWILIVAGVAVLLIGTGGAVGAYFYFKDSEDTSSA